MTKALHLFSDPKFADIHIDRFNDPSFENRFICLMADFQYEGSNLPLLEWVVPFSSAYDALQQNSSSFDLVFVYNLDYIKSCFINGLPKEVLVVWHLYGTEIYNNYEPFRFSIYSDLTRNILHLNRLFRLKSRVKRVLSRGKYFLLNKKATYDEIHLAILRVNFLAWYSKIEYDYIQSRLPFKLPAFLPLSVLVKEPADLLSSRNRTNSIWLGNSASPENNHLDILTLFFKMAFKDPIIVPFSYGGPELYTRFLKDFKKRTGLNIALLENFVHYNRFTDLIGNCRTAVFNSYRQMALGTIFISIKYGLKVYLNELNPSFAWLKSNGFHLYSIQQDFEADLFNNHLSLPPEYAAQNLEAYDKLISPFNNQLFLKQVTRLVNDWKNR
ncbi:MAG TPA: TDP-N-acetylfucosamine:lipid II N-acetylfucosaminyltransferase [Puia sp.]